MPARAPASIDMLQTVMRSSIESARTASPRYSMTWPVAPPTPMLRDDGQDQVLRRHARARAGRGRSTASVLGGQASRHWVAST